MMRTGIVTTLYGEIERRPFSRFTQVASEIDANNEWRKRAQAWGLAHIDRFGHGITSDQLEEVAS